MRAQQHKLKDKLPADQRFDAVVCFNSKLQACWGREANARTFLANAAGRLVPGGYFFGFLADSSHIWKRAQKELEKKEKNLEGQATEAGSAGDAAGFEVVGNLSRISFKDGHFAHFGCTYELAVDRDPKDPNQWATGVRQFLVHFPSLLRLAREVGLQCVTLSNFHEFFEDYRQLYGNMLAKLGVLQTERDKQLDKEQLELIMLYAVFVFQKLPASSHSKQGTVNTDGNGQTSHGRAAAVNKRPSEPQTGSAKRDNKIQREDS
eukprot:SAG31_NODE_3371_length_4353_cov_3.023507_4_plen_263_part_00